MIKNILLLLLLAVPAGAVNLQLVNPGTIVPWDDNGTSSYFPPITTLAQGHAAAESIMDDHVPASAVLPRSLVTCEWSAAQNKAHYNRGVTPSNSTKFPLYWPLVQGPDGQWDSSYDSNFDDHVESCVTINQHLAGLTVRIRKTDDEDVSFNPLDYAGPDGFLGSPDDVELGGPGSLWREYVGQPTIPLTVAQQDPLLEAAKVCECNGPIPSNPCWNQELYLQTGSGYDPNYVVNPPLPCRVFNPNVINDELSDKSNFILYPQACSADADAAGLCLNTDQSYTEGHLRALGWVSNLSSNSDHDWADGFTLLFKNEGVDPPTYNPVNAVQMHLGVTGFSDFGFGSGRNLRIRAWSCAGVELTPPNQGRGGLVDARHGLGGLVPQVVNNGSTTSHGIFSAELVVTLADLDNESKICAVQVDSPDGQKFFLNSFSAGDHLASAADVIPDDAETMPQLWLDRGIPGIQKEYVFGANTTTLIPTVDQGPLDLDVSPHTDNDRDSCHGGDYTGPHSPNNVSHPPFPLEEPCGTQPPACHKFADYDGDNYVKSPDFSIFLDYYNVGDLRADLDCSGTVNANDYSQKFLPAYQVGRP